MLEKSVKHIKGVGEKTAEDLASLNVYTIYDLIYYFPMRYEIHEVQKLHELIHEDTVTILGSVLYQPQLHFYGKNRSRLVLMIQVENAVIKAVIFNRPYAKKQINPGDQLLLTGKWDAHRMQITVNYYKKGPIKHQANIQPIYSLKGNITSGRLRKIIRQALIDYSDQIVEILPSTYLYSYKLPRLKDALWSIHYPKSKLVLKHARRRFIYEEFLLFQLNIQLMRKTNRKDTIGYAQHYKLHAVQEFIQTIPFELTNAQKRCVNEILLDLKSPQQMNRLLQGDVGSGKTVVAAICLYASITAGKQCALMVPTEILAEQHFLSLSKLFGNRVKIELLTGSIKGKKRKVIMEQIEANEIDIVIGTHALIQDDVSFHDLGFIIVDEQHRFGVEQRKALRDKGLTPDVLFMTATPIPRTLAITVFGDMDVSAIDEMPSGRNEVQTYWTTEQNLSRVLQFMQKHVEQGEQAYVVCPLIEESDTLDIQNAIDLYDELNNFYPEDIKIGLMHGRLANEEKESIMRRFASGEIHILVSTTVVEVGVNVPNATIMVIYDAERFGLAQLHQLRGRVGRGGKQSYCILIAHPKGEVGRERMRIMTETTDGFILAEQDLKLRGPGDFFGRKQSGLPTFKIADLIHDYRALETARRDAAEIINDNLLYEHPDFVYLKRYLQANDNYENIFN